MSQVSVIAKIAAKEGMRDELIAALQLGLDNVADEPGTLAG
jgi:quinol monooxygenase YgiN